MITAGDRDSRKSEIKSATGVIGAENFTFAPFGARTTP